MIVHLLAALIITHSGIAAVTAHNQTTAAAPAVYRESEQLCWGCSGGESEQFLDQHNLVRAAKGEPRLTWDGNLQDYAEWWAGERRSDCALRHSFPDDEFKLGENIFWGGGSDWGPTDAVRLWAGEERYYSYSSNTCEEGEQCGHYTQIVWRNTQQVGCARVICNNGDVFMTCNYDPPGNYVGERPY